MSKNLFLSWEPAPSEPSHHLAHSRNLIPDLSGNLFWDRIFVMEQFISFQSCTMGCMISFGKTTWIAIVSSVPSTIHSETYFDCLSLTKQCQRKGSHCFDRLAMTMSTSPVCFTFVIRLFASSHWSQVADCA